MINYQPGELLLVKFPFTSSVAAKVRPPLVILDSGDPDVVLARVTTQTYGGTFDIPILDWQQSGLLAPSVVRLHKLATIAKNMVHKRIGSLSAADRQSVADALHQVASTW